MEGGHPESGRSSGRPFWKTAFQDNCSGIGRDWIMGSDCSLVVTFGQAKAWVRAAAGPQRGVGGRDGWARCPALLQAPVRQCLGLSPALGSWLVIPMSEPVPIARLDPKATLLTLRSASLTRRQQDHGLSWEPVFSHRRGWSGLR